MYCVFEIIINSRMFFGRVMNYALLPIVELKRLLKFQLRRKLRFIGVFDVPSGGGERQWVVPVGDSLVRRQEFFRMICEIINDAFNAHHARMTESSFKTKKSRPEPRKH